MIADCIVLPHSRSGRWRSSHHQMYTRGSVIGTTTQKYGDISTIALLIFTPGGSEKFGLSFQPQIWAAASFRNGVRYLRSNINLMRFDDCSMSQTNLGKFGLCRFELARLYILDLLWDSGVTGEFWRCSHALLVTFMTTDSRLKCKNNLVFFYPACKLNTTPLVSKWSKVCEI